MKQLLIILSFCLPLVASAQTRPDSVRVYYVTAVRFMRMSENANDTATQRRYYDSAQHYIHLHQLYYDWQDAGDMQKRRDSINRKKQ
jgi:hypothetical protein